MHLPDDELKYLSALLRGVRDDLLNYAMPELTSGGAREHVQFAHFALDRYANEISMSPELTATFRGEFAALVAQIELMLGVELSPGHSAERSLPALRGQLAGLVRQLTDFSGKGAREEAAVKRVLAKSLAVESDLIDRLHKAQTDHVYRPSGNGLAIGRAITVESLASYLRSRYPSLPCDPVVELRTLPGGRSKRTIFVTLKPNADLPLETVIRQDMPGGAVDTDEGTTSVIREYPVLSALQNRVLPIPRVFLLEANDTQCGAPFILVERLHGTSPGTFLGFSNPGEPATRAVVSDMAAILARLHTLNIDDVGLKYDSNINAQDRLRREVEYRWDKWQRDAVQPSPIMECALARLKSASRSELGRPTLVHGDVMAHNVLADEGKITGLLDWEFAHIGDPAQDLAYCRDGVEQVMPWMQFMETYVSCGGEAISEERLALFGLVGMVRNYSFAATFSRRYMNGQSDNVADAAAGYFAAPIIERKLQLLLSKLATA